PGAGQPRETRIRPVANTGPTRLDPRGARHTGEHMPTRTRAWGGLMAALLAILAVLVLNAAPSSAATPYCRIDGDPELPSSCPVRRPTPPPPTMMTPTADPTPTPQPTMVPTSNPNVECWLEDFETDNIYATDTQREAYQFTVAVTFCVDKATRL